MVVLYKDLVISGTSPEGLNQLEAILGKSHSSKDTRLTFSVEVLKLNWPGTIYILAEVPD